MPRRQFAERHETRARATPAAFEVATREVTPREIALLRALDGPGYAMAVMSFRWSEEGA